MGNSPQNNDFKNAAKNARRVNPLSMPRAYAQIFDGLVPHFTVSSTDGVDITFAVKRKFNHARSSFYATLARSMKSDHGVLFFKGMDLPGRDEGAGKWGFVPDLKTIWAHKKGEDTPQSKEAERVFLEVRTQFGLKTLELVGYSIGSIFTNKLAVEHGAITTNIADLGFYTAQGQTPPNCSEKVTSLTLRADVLAKIGTVGPTIGDKITLDGDRIMPYLPGLGHIPQAYAAEAKRHLQV